MARKPKVAQTVRYPLRMKWRDRRHGLVDGGHDSPALSDLEAARDAGRPNPVMMSEYVDTIIGEFHERAERFRVLQERHIAEYRERQDNISRKIEQVQLQVDEHNRQIDAADAPMRPHEQLPGNPYDMARRSEELAARRWGIRAAQAKRLRKQLAPLVATVNAHRADKNGIEIEIIRVAATYGRAARAERRLARRRVSEYWDAVCRAHVHGQNLAKIVNLHEPEIPLPEWVLPDPDAHAHDYADLDAPAAHDGDEHRPAAGRNG